MKFTDITNTASSSNDPCFSKNDKILIDNKPVDQREEAFRMMLERGDGADEAA